MEEKKETKLRRRRWRGGIRQDSSRANGKGADLPGLPARVEFVAVEAKVDAARVSGLDDDFLPASHGTLAAGEQKVGGDSSTVGSD